MYFDVFLNVGFKQYDYYILYGDMKGHKMNVSGMSGFVQRLGITFVPKIL